MAKERNTTEVTGGITTPKPSVLDGLDFEPLAEPGEMQQAPGRRPGKNQLVAGYDNRRQEQRRTVKTNILVTPYIAAKMDEAAKAGEIKSRNDLINYLLEEYFKNR